MCFYYVVFCTERHTSLNIIRAKIRESRKDRNKRALIYEAIDSENFDPLIDLYTLFKESEPIMKKMAGAERRKRAVLYFFGACGLIGAVSSIIALFI